MQNEDFRKDLILPITKGGKSQIVYPPPWHYGVTYIAAHVKFTEDSVKELFAKRINMKLIASVFNQIIKSFNGLLA